MNFLGFKINEYSPTDGREVEVAYERRPVWITYSIFFPILRAKLFCLRHWHKNSLEFMDN